MPSVGSRYSLGIVVVYTASENIAKGQFLTVVDGDTVKVARADDPGLLKVDGAAFRAAAQGDKISMIAAGELRGLSALVPNVPYYLQTDGTAGLAPPRPGRAIRVGFAKNATTFHVRISDPTRLTLP